MKLTKAKLDQLILEVLQEKQEEHKSEYEREQYLRNQQKDAEERRQKKKQDGYVRIKADALQRMLTENNDNVQALCNKNRFFHLDQILDFISKLKQAEKGK